MLRLIFFSFLFFFFFFFFCLLMLFFSADNDDPIELPIPEQFKTVVKGNKLHTEQVNHSVG